MDELNGEKKVVEDIEYDDASSDEKETESEKVCENIGVSKGRSRKTGEHEKYMAERYLRMMNHIHSTNSNPFVYYQLSSSFISPSEFTPNMSSSTPLISPVNRISLISKRFQHSSTQPLDGQSYRFQSPQINNNWLNWLNINNLSTHSWTLKLFC